MRFYEAKFKLVNAPNWLFCLIGLLVAVNLFLGHLYPCLDSNVACLGVHPDYTVFREENKRAGHSNLFEGKVLEEFKSEYQHIKILKTPSFGEMLILDGRVQTTAFDGDFYHEMMVHVPVNALGLNKKDITMLIIGGGDLGAAYQALRHKNVLSVDLIDIDKAVVEVSNRHFDWAPKALNDDRFTVSFKDGSVAIKDMKASQYDIVIVDSTERATELSTVEFYKDCKKVLKKKGILVTNMNTAVLESEAIVAKHTKIKSAFQGVHLYQVAIPSFLSGHYMFAFASNSIDPPAGPINKVDWEAKGITSSYYTPDIHFTSFILPTEFRLGDKFKVDL